MRKQLFIFLTLALCFPTLAWGIKFTFSDKDFLAGKSWGEMEITAFDFNSLKVSYTAEGSAVIPSNSQVTAFGFSFSQPKPFDRNLLSISNPKNSDYNSDQDGLIWLELNKKNVNGYFPQPSNGDEFNPALTKTDFVYGATEGKDNNITPPGIKPGQTDIFFIDFTLSGLDLTKVDLLEFVEHAAIRLQSLPNNINGGSLFLAGKPLLPPPPPPAPVPEPATLVLVGSGLLGAALWRRNKP